MKFYIFFIQKLGESKSGLNANFEGPPQSYEELKQRCLQDGTLFEDNTFPASDASFYMHGRGPRRFKWLRPHEISDDPKFFNEGAERFDVCQGEIGNCWLLAGKMTFLIHNDDNASNPFLFCFFIVHIQRLPT